MLIIERSYSIFARRAIGYTEKAVANGIETLTIVNDCKILPIPCEGGGGSTVKLIGMS